MDYDLNKSREILSNTPFVLRTMLGGLSNEWLYNNEGDMTFSPFDVVGHLILGERNDWIRRIRTIVEHGESQLFDPFDRFSMWDSNKDKEIGELLDEFETLRELNLRALDNMNLTSEDLKRTGMHPSLGVVTLGNLLATWTTHDLAHISQIARVMAKNYKDAIGPWSEFMGLVSR
ncbi:DinB family protein [Calditrichota bacterium]